MSTIALATSANSNLQKKIVAEIEIPTASAIVIAAESPSLVLIGSSAKHKLPVLPGGKIDLNDQSQNQEILAYENCIRREIMEEIGADIQGLTFLFKHSNPKADNRIIEVSSLRGTINDALVSEYQDDDQVLGKYGVPDYVFLVVVDPKTISDSSELKELRWIDCNSVEAKNLGADHSEVLRMYSQMLGDLIKHINLGNFSLKF